MYVGRIGLQYVIYKGWNKHKGDLSYIMVMSTETFESNVQIFMCGVCVCVCYWHSLAMLSGQVILENRV